MKIVIIGLGTAAFTAILAIRKIDRNAEITVIDKKTFDLQHSCGLPYALEGKIDVKRLEHAIDSKALRVDIISDSEALKIDRKNKEVEYIKNGAISKIKYDKLLIDTGSLPFIPLIPGLKENENNYTLKSTADIKMIEKAIKNSKSAAIIGAGAIGIETAFALMKRGLKVTIIEALSCLFPRAIDSDMSAILEENLKANKINILLDQKINKIDGKKIILEKDEVSADIIICATGVRPNIKLAFEAGIKTSQFGIIVDKHMRTADPDIYAAGDCTEAVNLITGTKFESQLATTAYKQGTIAGENIAGKNTEYHGSISTFASVIGELEVACTGLNSFYAKEAGFEAIIGKSNSSDKPEWFGESEKITLKILIDKKGKILGAQAIGKNAFARINVVSTAITLGMKVQDLSNVELSYCPAVSQTYDVLQQAADLAIRKMK